MIVAPVAVVAGRWLMWGVPAALFLVAFFHRVAPGVIAKDLMTTFEMSGTVVGLLSATYFYAYAGLMVPAGVCIDAFGVRRMVTIGGAVMGLGAMAMGAAEGHLLLFAGRLLVGAGATTTFVGALKIAAVWFPPSQFGTLSAVTATVGVLGSLVATAPLAALVSLAGWRGALWLVGLLTVACAVLCVAVVRDRPPHAAASEQPSSGLADVLGGTFQVVRNRHTWPPFLAFFCLYTTMGNLMLWVIPFLRDVYGLSMTRAAFYATATSTALLLAAPLTGYLSDAVFRRRKAPYTILTAGLGLVWVAFVATLGALPLGALYAIFFAMGLFGGAFVLTWPIGREVNPPHLAGVAVAVVNLGGFLGAAITQGPLGAVLDARWAGAMEAGARVYPLDAYRAAFAVCALFVVGALLLSLLLRETRGRNMYAA
ncbi:MAG: MFS transporter [Candidatus Rokuibacteriota bacterium]